MAWSYQIEVLQQELLAERKVQEINQTIETESGPIAIKEAVITPISTTIFFDLSQASNEDIPLVLITQNNEYTVTNESYMNIEEGSNSYFRFYDLDYQANDYYLIVEDDEIGWKLPIGTD